MEKVLLKPWPKKWVNNWVQDSLEQIFFVNRSGSPQKCLHFTETKISLPPYKIALHRFVVSAYQIQYTLWKNIYKTYRKIILTPTARHINPQVSDRINVCFYTSHTFYMNCQFPLPSVDQPRNISMEYNVWLYTRVLASQDTFTNFIMG